MISRLEANRLMRKLSRSQKLEYCREMFPFRQEVRRDFVLFDTSNHPRFPSGAMLMHLPSMLFTAMNFSFDTALEFLADPSRDQELIRGIYGLGNPDKIKKRS
jgi:hypothetical protein